MQKEQVILSSSNLSLKDIHDKVYLRFSVVNENLIQLKVDSNKITQNEFFEDEIAYHWLELTLREGFIEAQGKLAVDSENQGNGIGFFILEYAIKFMSEKLSELFVDCPPMVRFLLYDESETNWTSYQAKKLKFVFICNDPKPLYQKMIRT